MNKYKISIGINIILLLALMVCVFFLTKKETVKEIVIEPVDCLNYYCFDGIQVRVFPEKRVLQLGEEYTAEILLQAIDSRKEYSVAIYRDDTNRLEGIGSFLLIEKPKKRGLVEREGSMIYFNPCNNDTIELRFKFNYTVE